MTVPAVYSYRFDLRSLATPNVWVNAYTVPSGHKAIVRALTAINTSASAYDLILGVNSGAQVLRFPQLAPSSSTQIQPWLIFNEGETLQWQHSGGTFWASIHGQLLLLA